MENEYHFGELVAQNRAELGLSQSELAKSCGISQATMSRLENASEYSGDLRLLIKIARALEVRLRDLIPDLSHRVNNPDESEFFAFCPNPFCSTNTQLTSEPFLVWSSLTSYDTDQFDSVNFCVECGSALVKECPSCQRRIEDNRHRFCLSCGARICERPNDEDLAKLRGENIPF
jgi:transcriptional regulator with XRE-family HTH domain